MLLPLYAAALFLGSLLLFGIQPMVTRMVLPQLGGSPAVWNTAQVFFQLLLLGGYLYAHLVTHYLGTRFRLIVHFSLLGAAFLLMPVGISAGWEPPLQGSPVPSLLGVLTLSIGLPFFAVATTAPLMQSWFARTVHASASDPYFLYSASNLGGLVALLGYPFIFEPSFALGRQGALWAWGFGVLVILIATAGWLLPRGAPVALPTSADKDEAAAQKMPHGWRVRVRWILLAFAPSSLMLGLTLHISTDVAATPFLWVVPLALYVLSYVIAFARRPLLPHAWMLRLQPVLIALLVMFFDTHRLAIDFALHLGAFFVTAMVCHGELARSRPHVSRLTEFYIWLSLGGVLGGAFSGVLAPMLFNAVMEYPIALVLACALRPATAANASAERFRDIALPIGLALFYLLANFALPSESAILGEGGRLMLAMLVCLILFTFRLRTGRFALAIALLLIAERVDLGPRAVLAQERSFFGVHRVIAERGYHLLIHGGTVHGAESIDARYFREPLTYYTREGPAGQTFSILSLRRPEAKIGAIGLGSGAITCFLGDEQVLTFFEIDPVVVRLATDTRYFGYLSGCGRNVRVVLGDGRRSLRNVPDGAFDLLVLDAFSSDAIPAHLLTREAMAIYVRALAPGGLLLVHVSNRYLDLVPVIAALVADTGLAARVQTHEPAGPGLRETYRWKSTWVLVGGGDDELTPFNEDPRWRRLTADDGSRPWTDDYSNIAGAVKWGSLW